MKITGLKYAGGLLTLASVALAYNSSAAPVVLDDFDTYAGAGVGQVGFNISDTTADATAVTDGTDVVPNPNDTIFANLQRVVGVNLQITPGSPNAIRANNQTGGIVAFSSDAGTDGDLTLKYTFFGSSGVDLNNSWDRFRFLFLRNDSPGSTFSVTLQSSSGTGSQLDTITTAIPFIPSGSPAYVDLVFNPGNSLLAAYNNAKIITFTINPADDSADIRFDAAYLDNPGVPEASTTVPALAFAGFIGGWAWRRAKAKKA